MALTRAYAFRSVDGEALPLYSDENVLPGVLFEYEIGHRDASDDGAGARQADAKAATDRWAERCKLAGLGYVADEQRQLSAVALRSAAAARCAPPPARRTTATRRGGGDRFVPRAVREREKCGAGRSAARDVRCGCGRRKRWYCTRCRAWLPSVAPPAARLRSAST